MTNLFELFAPLDTAMENKLLSVEESAIAYCNDDDYCNANYQDEYDYYRVCFNMLRIRGANAYERADRLFSYRTNWSEEKKEMWVIHVALYRSYLQLVRRKNVELLKLED